MIQDRWGPNRVGPFGPAPADRRRHQVHLQGRHHPGRRAQAALHAGAGAGAHPGAVRVRRHPVRPDDRRSSAATIPLVIVDLDGGLLFAFAATSLGVYGIVLAGWSSQQQVLADRRAALLGADDLLRAGAGALARRGASSSSGTLRPIDDRRRSRRAGSGTGTSSPAAGSSWASSSSSSPGSPRPTACPSTCPRPRRAGRRLPHRVLVDEVRDVLHGRVRQHDDRPRRSAVTLFLGGWQLGLPGVLARAGLAALAPADRRLRRQGRPSSCSSSSGCAGRCRASATTS